MRSWGVLSLLGSLCAVWHLAYGQCDLSGKKTDVAFPDLEKEGIESYQLSVEYTLPDASQTDYFVEYYDILYRRGRIEAHQAGNTMIYLYRTASWEAWDMTGGKCDLKNITDVSQMFKDDQTDWMYIPGEKYDRRTIGPSAMFKIALDDWNARDSDKNIKMNFMGKSESLVRGLPAFYWRRCDSETSYIDYFFTTDDEENPYGLKSLTKIPLRVTFGGKREGREAKLANQQYEIMNFQPYISIDVKPFELPVGRECKRGDNLQDVPKVPDFAASNLMLGAEVIYRKVDRSGDDVQYWSYFSTLSMALDRASNHLAYFYTPWDQSTKNDDEPKAKAPEHIIYDMKHGYIYKYALDDGQCTIGRVKSFDPKFTLPNDAGAISLTDPTILYPNGNMYYITEGTVRGLKVNIFEETVLGYVLDKGNEKIQIKKAVISHAYLQDDVVEMNTGSTKNALVQVKLRFSREENVFEDLTLNFFGFSTNLRRRRNIFNIKRCFKNDDDYVWVKLGFDADPNVLKKIQNDVPSIEANILGAITARSELNPVRIPIVQVDFKEALVVELMLLEKPPVMLDYLSPEDETAVLGSSEIEGVTDINTCAKRCLEKEVNCWGFSICGAVCTFGAGTTTSAKTGPKKGCKLYRRYNNDAFIPSNELMVQNLRYQIPEHSITLVLFDKDGEKYQLEATSIEVTDPGEDDRIFNRIGNIVNSRLRPLKVGYKLDDANATAVKNLGKLRFDTCQSVCLDFKRCETVSYCIDDSSCILSETYGEEIPSTDFKENNLCEVLTVKYSDHFNRSPGVVLTVAAQEVLKLDTVEKCARACLKATKYECKSFDHCPIDENEPCKLHVLHYPNSKTREPVQTNSSNCGHYYRKYSTEFQVNLEKRIINSKIPPLTNLTLEECASICMEYGNGTCYGFDFCQDALVFATSCVLFDSDVTKMKTTYSPICANYFRPTIPVVVPTEKPPQPDPNPQPKPYTNGYAAGIGILCFVVGGVVGVGIVFGIAYLKVNRR